MLQLRRRVLRVTMAASAAILISEAVWPKTARAKPEIAASAKGPTAGLELTISSFSPQIGTAAARNYHNDTAFPGGALMLGIAVTRYFDGKLRLHPAYGALGLQLGIARWKAEGEEPTELKITPVSLTVVWRHDQLKRLWALPLIGYLKLGGDCYFWKGNGAFHTSLQDNTSAKKGYAVGMHGALGLGFDFDLGRAPLKVDYVSAVLLAEIAQSLVKSYDFGKDRGDDPRFDFSSTQVRIGVIVDF